MKEKATLLHEVVCFQMLDFETSQFKSEVSKSNRGKLLLSRELRYFRGSRFSQCLILATALHYSLQESFYAKSYFE